MVIPNGLGPLLSKWPSCSRGTEKPNPQGPSASRPPTGHWDHTLIYAPSVVFQGVPCGFLNCSEGFRVHVNMCGNMPQVPLKIQLNVLCIQVPGLLAEMVELRPFWVMRIMLKKLPVKFRAGSEDGEEHKSLQTAPHNWHEGHRNGQISPLLSHRDSSQGNLPGAGGLPGCPCNYFSKINRVRAPSLLLGSQ